MSEVLSMVKSAVSWLNENIEKCFILVSYTAMGTIIFSQVIMRFFFQYQSAWSTTIPIYLFLWLTWMGASLNTKNRTHLRFNEVRERLSYKAQYICLLMDAIVWYVFSGVVLFYTIQQVQLSHDNFAIVQGTDDVMQWWFYMAIPLSFSLLLFRVTQNFIVDTRMFKAKQPLIITTTMFGD
ncbi:MAG: TRAP-type C4-dicarboxylate transport system permease small subunit [Cellvibrionaceae bacterium]|jgi:TRAP-type C4-dicarboxylate transport system permease small subunit